MDFFSMIGALFLSASVFFSGSDDALSSLLMKLSAEQTAEMVGFFGSKANAVESEKVQRIVSVLGMQEVPVLVTKAGMGTDGLYSAGHIFLSDDLAGKDESEIAYVLAHEYGHHKLNHREHAIRSIVRGLALKGVRGDISIRALSKMEPPKGVFEVSRKHEFEADAFAKKLLMEKGLWSPSGTAVKAVLGTVDASDSHPSSSDRLRALGID